mmetsp:Transcript_13843/g.34062  ORF Transcript_13843/g.34062 Transcript_13843/m.34062 type:complete len:760 (-) Transcript_13843:300-2579(-)
MQRAEPRPHDAAATGAEVSLPSGWRLREGSKDTSATEVLLEPYAGGELDAVLRALRRVGDVDVRRQQVSFMASKVVDVSTGEGMAWQATASWLGGFWSLSSQRPAGVCSGLVQDLMMQLEEVPEVAAVLTQQPKPEAWVLAVLERLLPGCVKAVVQPWGSQAAVQLNLHQLAAQYAAARQAQRQAERAQPAKRLAARRAAKAAAVACDAAANEGTVPHQINAPQPAADASGVAAAAISTQPCPSTLQPGAAQAPCAPVQKSPAAPAATAPASSPPGAPPGGAAVEQPDTPPAQAEASTAGAGAGAQATGALTECVHPAACAEASHAREGGSAGCAAPSSSSISGVLRAMQQRPVAWRLKVVRNMARTVFGGIGGSSAGRDAAVLCALAAERLAQERPSTCDVSGRPTVVFRAHDYDVTHCFRSKQRAAWSRFADEAPKGAKALVALCSHDDTGVLTFRDGQVILDVRAFTSRYCELVAADPCLRPRQQASHKRRPPAPCGAAEARSEVQRVEDAPAVPQMQQVAAGDAELEVAGTAAAGALEQGDGASPVGHVGSVSQPSADSAADTIHAAATDAVPFVSTAPAWQLEGASWARLLGGEQGAVPEQVLPALQKVRAAVNKFQGLPPAERARLAQRIVCKLYAHDARSSVRALAAAELAKQGQGGAHGDYAMRCADVAAALGVSVGQISSLCVQQHRGAPCAGLAPSDSSDAVAVFTSSQMERQQAGEAGDCVVQLDVYRLMCMGIAKRQEAQPQPTAAA